MANDNQAWAKIVAKAWSDEAFKQKLLSDPAGVCKEQGVELPAGVTLQLHENTGSEVHMTLPAKPSGELSQQQLEQVAAGQIGVADFPGINI